MRASFAHWLESIGFEDVTPTAIGARAKCPFCSSGSRQTFSLHGTRYKCFSASCGAFGSLSELAQKLGVTIPAWVWDSQEEAPEEAKADLPEIPRYRLYDYRVPYTELEARGIPKYETDEWDLRWDHRRNAMLIPIHDFEGRIVSCAWRHAPPAKMRYQNLRGMPRDRLLYGLHRAIQKRPRKLYLVEGFGDAWKAWACGVPAVATFGASLTKGQVNLLYGLGFRSLGLMYDNDRAGATGASKAYLSLIDKADVTLHMAYRGPWPKDPGDADRSVFAHLVTNPISYTELMDRKARHEAPKSRVFTVDIGDVSCDNDDSFPDEGSDWT